jgi:hypothetical protein
LGERAAYEAVAREQISCRKSGAWRSHVKLVLRGGGRMTAEIAIVNSQAIALAADSAITVGRERVWKHANKLFSLGPVHDIGIMIYNSGDFLGISWEIIIKQFRSSIAGHPFRTLLDCSESFQSYLQRSPFADRRAKDFSISSVIFDIIDDIRIGIGPEIKDKQHMLTAIDRQLKESTDTMQLIGTVDYAIDNATFIDRYKPFIDDVCKDMFRYTLDAKHIQALYAYVYLAIARKKETAFSTGLVFAGFGRDEYRPVLQKCIVDGMDDGIFRYWQEEYINLSDEDAPLSFIRPFAQSDIAFLFVEGIVDKYLYFLKTLVTEVLNDKSESLVRDYVRDKDEQRVEGARQKKDNGLIVQKVMDGFEAYRKEELVDRLMDVITPLPKEEMAILAEAIVELTSLRRRMESQTETVGGPIDVAVISKGDGFIWIKRKHYFDIERNRDFLYRKEARMHSGGEGEGNGAKTVR